MRQLSTVLSAVLILFVLILPPAPAAAQDLAPAPEGGLATATKNGTPLVMLRQLAPSHPEKVLLAFFKTAGIEPDFAKWASVTPFLKDAKEMDKPVIIQREETRLRDAWLKTSSGDPLAVQIQVNLDSYSTLQEMLELSEFTSKTFFSFSLYGQNVAIVPKGVEAFGKLPMKKPQMEEILEKTKGSAATAELLLKPVVADAKTPFMHNGVSYGLLLAEIAEIRLWTRGAEPQLLWMHRADWYTPKEDSTLMNLKSGM